MNKFPITLFLLYLSCIALSAFALGGREKASTPSTSSRSSAAGVETQEVEVSGTVRMVGNSPMTSLVISGENRKWYIAPEEENKLAEFQQQTVTVRAQEYYYDRTFANGLSAGRQYFLKDIVIVKAGY